MAKTGPKGKKNAFHPDNRNKIREWYKLDLSKTNEKLLKFLVAKDSLVLEDGTTLVQHWRAYSAELTRGRALSGAVYMTLADPIQSELAGRVLHGTVKVDVDTVNTASLRAMDKEVKRVKKIFEDEQKPVRGKKFQLHRGHAFSQSYATLFGLATNPDGTSIDLILRAAAQEIGAALQDPLANTGARSQQEKFAVNSLRSELRTGRISDAHVKRYPEAALGSFWAVTLLPELRTGSHGLQEALRNDLIGNPNTEEPGKFKRNTGLLKEQTKIIVRRDNKFQAGRTRVIIPQEREMLFPDKLFAGVDIGLYDMTVRSVRAWEERTNPYQRIEYSASEILLNIIVGVGN